MKNGIAKQALEKSFTTMKAQYFQSVEKIHFLEWSRVLPMLKLKYRANEKIQQKIWKKNLTPLKINKFRTPFPFLYRFFYQITKVVKEHLRTSFQLNVARPNLQKCVQYASLFWKIFMRTLFISTVYLTKSITRNWGEDGDFVLIVWF